MAGCRRPCATFSRFWRGSMMRSAPRSPPLTRTSWPCTGLVRRAGGWQRSRASAQSAPPRWLPRSATGTHSDQDVVFRPGSGWCRSNTAPGRDRLGRITKQGNRYLRWLLVVGAMAVIRYRAQARNREATMAWPIDGAPADESGGCGARQQDCENGLGHHGPQRKIQRAETVAGGLRHAGS